MKLGLTWSKQCVHSRWNQLLNKAVSPCPVHSVAVSESETCTVTHLPVLAFFECHRSVFSLGGICSAWIMPTSPRVFLTPQSFLKGINFNSTFGNVIHNLLIHEYL